jgi:hypothetical protein
LLEVEVEEMDKVAVAVLVVIVQPLVLLCPIVQ